MAAVIGEAQPSAAVAEAAGLRAAPFRFRSRRTRVLLVVDTLAAVVGALAVQSRQVEARPSSWSRSRCAGSPASA